MTQAKIGSQVKVHYTGRLEDGTQFDSSREGQPLEFTIGSGQIIPGFEQAVIGMTPGESKTATIPADQAYGPHYDEMVIEVPRQQIPAHIEPEVGQKLEIHQSDRVIDVTVTEVSHTSVTLDANHPLAGKDLVFDIQLMELA